MDTNNHEMSVVRCPLSVAERPASNDGPRTTDYGQSRGFTLVELLVVITIIGILAALITVAAVGALKTARKTQIKAEINEIAGGFDEYKNKTTAYPPNCQTGAPMNSTVVLNNLRRHIQQIASRSQESDDLARVLVGLQPADSSNYPRILAGGISASEAVVFWLGGFSADPKFPISGDGGPSYVVTGIAAGDRRKADPISSRASKFTYPFDVDRLGPRASDGYFDESKGRYIEYTDPKGVLRRINFWEYYPTKSSEPLVYFDTSRHPVGTVNGGNLIGTYDPPGATYAGAGNISFVYAFKKALDAAAPATAPQIQFINPDKFQVLHCGIDGQWDKAGFTGMAPGLAGKPNSAGSFTLFPTGPFTGEFADTQVNFATETTIEDAQK